MQWLAEVCVRRPVFATVLVLVLVVVGIYGYTQLQVDLFPKVDFPVVTVTVTEQGASPQEIETDVVDKIEEAVNTISGIDSLSSVSYDGVGQVIVTFVLEKDIDVAVEEVRAKVNEVLPDLPSDIKPPVIDKVDPDAAPILQLALSAPDNIRNISEYADKVLRRQIESIDGVGQVTLLGTRKRQINIYLNPYKLRSYGLTALDVERALQAQNLQTPGGDVDEGAVKLTVRTLGRVTSPQQFSDIVIAKGPGGSFIHVGDVAQVVDGTEEPSTVADLVETGVSHPIPTVLLSIRKQSGLNTVATVQAVKQRLAEIRPTLPPGYNIRIVRDQSTYILASTREVMSHLKLGSLLAALVVLVFLWNFRTTIISGLAIPASIISTFVLLYAMGFTLNLLTLLGLTLAVGIVIDDAIVVLENIYRFIEEKGMRPFEAAIEATREIGLAVLATTLSLVAIFLPIAFMTGITGRFLKSFGLTMAFSILVSLFVSFSLTPMLASRWLKPRGLPGGTDAPEWMPVGVPGEEEPTEKRLVATSKQRGFFHWIDTTYTAILKWCLGGKWGWHRIFVLIACLLSLMSMAIVVPLVPKNFLPDNDQSQFQISVRAPEGTSLVATQALADRIARETLKLPDVEYAVVTIGDNPQKTQNLASIYVQMKQVEDRTDGYTQQDVQQMVRTEILPKYGNIRATAGPIPAFSSGAPQAAITYSLSGPDLNLLAQYSQQILNGLKKIPGVVDADTSLVLGVPEIDVVIDRQRAADLGVSVADLANTLHLLVGDQQVTDYFEGGEQYEVHMRAALQYRDNPEILKQLTVPSTTVGSVPLDQVVHLVQTTGPAQINRLNRQRNVLITCNILPGYSQQAIGAQIVKMFDQLHLPPQYRIIPFGTSRELIRAFKAFVVAFLLAIIFMYLILAAQFESWVYPIAIMSALPLTAPFAFLSIYLFHRTVNIFSILGILVLFGVVKKNGILQIDHTNQLRARGMNRFDAIIQANRDRLRPILMTTIAFVAGLIPLVLSKGSGAETNKDIGYTVMGGQTLSLLLTLLATPVIYSILDDLAILFYRVRGSAADGITQLIRRLRRR
ncbi:efflux RND transporter permease subunit [Chthonomonas calidirosea]|uniref:efflux RND transporter permease subunit n=1 Tax=Chthonomonas calidirosea TaxID=454171 RepID=UPI0006EC703A|nr:efflux RND transporter permease subunit [Chthonomonas calidirosea]CEK16770.1 cation/multidrug efflux pump [Chthonomonas calidirosea]